MHVAVTGALVGAGAGVLLFIVDYYKVRGYAADRAKRYNKPIELDATERKQISSMIPLCLSMPPAFAALFWLLSIF